MSDDPTARVPLDPVEPEPIPPDAEQPRPRGLARDLALGAIAFVAVLLLLLGATRLMERGGALPSPSASQAAAAPSPTTAPSASTYPRAERRSHGQRRERRPVGIAGRVTGDQLPRRRSGAGRCRRHRRSAARTVTRTRPPSSTPPTGTVFTAGDNAYETGSARDFSQCYQPSWGRHLARTRPAPGNHDWETRRAEGLPRLLRGRGAGPGRRRRGTRTTSGRGTSSCSIRCATRSAAAMPRRPRASGSPRTSRRPTPPARWRSSTTRGSAPASTATSRRWTASGDRSTRPAPTLIVNGHDHDYERFAPQDPDGKADPARGIREFVVGTGGAAAAAVQRRQSAEQRAARRRGARA